jgi:hypothetical protein
MAEKEFFTASEMTAYIETRYNKRFSRSIISRHLGEMGYSYKNVSQGSDYKDDAKFNKIRKTYAEIMCPLFERDEKLIYFDEMSCYTGEEEEGKPKVISIMVACTSQGVLFTHMQEGFFTREHFFDILKDFLSNLRKNEICLQMQGQREELYIVVDTNAIHRDSNSNLLGLATMLI